VRFEWDALKAAANLSKHGVDFADATTALEDSLAATIRDPNSRGEDRYITIGMDALSRLLVVVYTMRGEALRIISARQATSRERRQYEEPNA
jgi:uncharacterized DUF497 family protein